MLKWIFTALLVASALQLKADQPVQDGYSGLYVECHDGEQLEKAGDYLGALTHYRVALPYLKAMNEKYPTMEQVLVHKKIQDLQDKIAELQPKATKQYNDLYLDLYKGTNSSGAIYVLLRDADSLEKTHNYWGALNESEKSLIMLEIIHRDDPLWESSQVEEKIKQTQKRIDHLEALALQEQTNNRSKDSTVQ